MKEKYNIPFSPPDITELEVELVSEALKSGWITTGPKTKELERKIASYVGAERAICLNSATAALELCLRAIGIGPNDEVITSAYSYTASASVIEHVGAKVVLVDCMKDDLFINYDAIEKAITKNTKAIIPVDIAGIPCDYDRLFEIVEKKKDLFTPSNNPIQKAFNRIILLDDGAHSFGASYKGKMMGSVADFTSFSFHAVKNFTTAEGGALTWDSKGLYDSEELYNLLQLYSLHGQNKDALKKNQIGAWEYDIVGTWYKCNMTDIMASIGLAQFTRYDSLLKRREEIIGKYDEAFEKIGVQVLNHYTKDYRSSGHLYITRIPNISDEQRREIIVKMGEMGVACNVHYKPMPMMSAYKNMGFDIKDYPNSYDFYINEITLPLYTRLTDDEVEYIIETFTSIVKEYI